MEPLETPTRHRPVGRAQELLRFQEERRIAAMVKLAERDRQDRQARRDFIRFPQNWYPLLSGNDDV